MQVLPVTIYSIYCVFDLEMAQEIEDNIKTAKLVYNQEVSL